MPFAFERDPRIPDVIVIEPPSFLDERGWFSESFKASVFAAHGIDAPFVQSNRSFSAQRGTLRGLHLQIEPFAQGKLIQCLRGGFFDVAVDIRQGSPTSSRWVGVDLTAASRRMVWIPAGFAHGALSMEDGSELIYWTTAEYSPAHERVVAWNDRSIGITWPIDTPRLSPRDASAPPLAALRRPPGERR